MEEQRAALQDYYEKLAPAERRSRVILKPEFRDTYNEIVRAHRHFPVPEYLWKTWLPVIGPLPVVVYLQLRRYCFYNPDTGERRNICWPKQSTLAAQVGIKDRKTLRKALVVLEQHGFIEREHKHYPDPVSGRPHQVADEYTVWFELPLRPEDAAELLIRQTSAGEERDFRPYGGIISPHSLETASESSYEGKSSPQRGGEKTASRNVTRTMNNNVPNVAKPRGTERLDIDKQEALALEVGECLNTWAGERSGKRHASEGFHRRVSRMMPEHLVREALRATRDAVDRSRGGKGPLTHGPAAYFAGVVKNLAVENQIELGLRTDGAAHAVRPIPRPKALQVARSAASQPLATDEPPLDAQKAKAVLGKLLETLQAKHSR